jgi:hypothetical protein
MVIMRHDDIEASLDRAWMAYLVHSTIARSRFLRDDFAPALRCAEQALDALQAMRLAGARSEALRRRAADYRAAHAETVQIILASRRQLGDA